MFPPFRASLKLLKNLQISPNNNLTNDDWETTIESRSQSDGGPGSGRYPKGSGENVSNGNRITSCYKPGSAMRHLAKRQRDGHYIGMTEKQYEDKTIELLNQKVEGNIVGYETDSGKVVRWDKSTGNYATGMKGGSPVTMFPLRGGNERYERLRQRDLGEDGSGGSEDEQII